MTRPLTKRELTAVAKPVSQFALQEVSVHEVLVFSVSLGIGIGILLATLMLSTDAFGIFSLIKAQAAPLTTATIFVLVCSVKCTALVLVSALAIAAV